MSHDLNDPRLTAYALGELEESELPEVYRLLAESPESRRFVEETRSLGRTLTDQLRAESGPGLTESHWRAIEERLPSLPQASAFASASAPVLAFAKFPSDKQDEEIVGPDRRHGARPSRAAVLRWGGLLAAALALIAFGLAMTSMKPGPSAVALNGERDRTSSPAPNSAPVPDPNFSRPTPKASASHLSTRPLNDSSRPTFLDAERQVAQDFRSLESESAQAGQGQAPGSPPRELALNMFDGAEGKAYSVRGANVPQTGDPPQRDRLNALAEDASPKPNANEGVSAGKPASPQPRLGDGNKSFALDMDDHFVQHDTDAVPPMEPAQSATVRARGGRGAVEKREALSRSDPSSSSAKSASPASGPDAEGLGDDAAAQAPRSFRGRVQGAPQLARRAQDEGRKSGMERSIRLNDQIKEADSPQFGSNSRAKFADAARTAAPGGPSPVGAASEPTSAPAPAPAPARAVAIALAPASEAAPASSGAGRYLSGASGGAAGLGEVKKLTKGDDAKNGFATPEVARKRLEVLNQQRSAVRADESQIAETTEERGLKTQRSELELLAVAPDRAQGNEGYATIVENEFKSARTHRLDTFAADVDTASYANVRRFLTQNTMPPPDAVRIEELVNYFTYNDPDPSGDDRFSVNLECARCPWNADNRLVRIGLQAKRMRPEQRPSSNLVFLLDVSGSMQDQNKLPLLKTAMGMLLDQLGERDRVAIVTYSEQARVALASTPANQPQVIRGVIDGLRAEGSTNGGSGLHRAYETAVGSFIPGGINRIILCSDGDFNVDVTSDNDLVRLIEERAKSGVYLSVFGFGIGNLKDSKLEKIADKGNGHYGYIDTLNEARKAFVTEAESTLAVAAKDVKIQVDFNPDNVAAYRLLGYENRALRNRDFRDDAKDAGEMGAGHSVTAFYEIVPARPTVLGKIADSPNDPLRYSVQQRETTSSTPAQAKAEAGAADPKLPLVAEANLIVSSQPTAELKAKASVIPNGALLTVRLRSQPPEGGPAQEIERFVVDDGKDYASASEDFRFGSSAAAFGMLLRGSRFRGNITYDAVLELAKSAQGSDPFGYRKEFLELAAKAKELDRRQDPARGPVPLAAPAPSPR